MSFSPSFICTLTILGVGCGLPNVALAQGVPNTPIPDAPIIVTGLRPIHAPLTNNVIILGPQDLEARNGLFAVDLLAGLPSLSISRSGGPGGLTQVRMGGAAGNHTKVLIDSIDASDPITGETDFSLINGLPISSVQIGYGGLSSFHGSDAIGGVINFGFDHGIDGPNVLFIAGAHNDYDVRLGLNRQYDAGDFQLAATGARFAGVDVSGLGGERDGVSLSRLFARGQIALSDGWDVSTLATIGQTKAQTDPDDDFDGRLENGDRLSNGRFALFGVVIENSQNQFHQRLNFSAQQTRRTNFSGTIRSDETNGTRYAISYLAGADGPLMGGQFSWSALLDGREENYARMADVGFFGDPNQKASSSQIGLSLDGQFSVGDFSLQASGRHELHDGLFADSNVWRLGGSYMIAPNFSLYANYGLGVKNPTFTEIFGYIPASFIGNQNLKAERSGGWELGVRGGSNSEVINWQAGANIFGAKLEDEIITQFNLDFTSQSVNRTGSSKRSGAAAYLFVQGPRQHMSLSASTSQSRGQNGQENLRVPAWTGSLGYGANLGEGQKFDLTMDIIGQQIDTDFASFTNVELPAYVSINGQYEFPISANWVGIISGTNLFNAHRIDVVGFHQAGPEIRFGIRFLP